ncbi:uncharacterized protein ELE39_003266 [Cryptosporidium sp. chipmunk genotype I]|uniref:uncharacterized protein n=1 Tax=Cryptosporidium sp. chipmunk genotype I TaxID=1280935 RepID=UPI00351A7B1C|nr:hypothetical protein ELE39_003266 [Cryptosporidium sp. chipmunk genotype I]
MQDKVDEQFEETLRKTEESLQVNNSIELNSLEETLNPSLIISTIDKGNILSAKKKQVLMELKEKWKDKKQNYLYELDEILDNLSDYSLNESISFETNYD